MARPAPLLLAYDAECRLCRGLVDRLQARDRWGLLVAFPLQDVSLLRVAPELAGRPLHLALHGLDTASRRVFAGADLIPEVMRRLPRWRWVAWGFRLTWVAALARRVYLGVAARRYRLTGRAPGAR